MFGFLRDSWAPQDRDSSDDEGTDPSPRQNDIFPASVSLSPCPSDVNIAGSNMSTIDDNPMSRLRQLEDQNARMVTQLSSLQEIISVKSSLYLDYKAKYEVLVSAVSQSLFYFG